MGRKQNWSQFWQRGTWVLQAAFKKGWTELEDKGSSQSQLSCCFHALTFPKCLFPLNSAKVLQQQC